MEQNNSPERLPLSKKIIYALGQFGWSLVSYAPGMLLVYYYMPPESGEATFELRIFQGAVLGFFTLIGLAYAAGRLFDAITDPLIAGMTDRSRSRFGRRRKYLAISVLPFALLSYLVFAPPVPKSSPINTVWVFVTLILFYWFMTMYVTPYFAWLSELGHTPDERLFLSTLISITWALGAAVGSQVYTFKGIFESTGYSPGAAFRMTIGIFSVAGFILMLLPVFFIDENKYCERHSSSEGVFEALFSALKNRNFRLFAMSDLAYWVAMTIVSTGLVYFVTILMRMEESFASTFQLMMFGLSFIFYIPVNLIAKKTGKKHLLIIAFFLFMAAYAFVGFLGIVPLPSEIQGYILVVLMALPMAIFGILPNAIIADIAEADGIETGNFKAGIFFGARTFMQKMGQMIGGLLFPSLLLLGNTPGNSIGIRLASLAALIFIVGGLIFFFLFNEKSVLKSLAKKEKLSKQELKEINQ